MHEGGCVKEFFTLTCRLASRNFIIDSSDINEGIKAVLFFKRKKMRAKSFRPNELVKVRTYIRTFTNLLGPSEYANLLVQQK